MANLVDLVTVPLGSDVKGLARLFLIPLDANTAEPLSDALPTIRLQYWPETISYTRGNIGWQQREIPGLSHALLSWTANGSPALTFECLFTTDHDPAYHPLSAFTDGSNDIPRDVDINSVLAWFAATTNPDYAESIGSEFPVQPPPIIQIVPESLSPVADAEDFANSLNQNIRRRPAGGSPTSTRGSLVGVGVPEKTGTSFSHVDGDFFGVVTDFSVVYEKFFPSGFPRIVRVSLSFLEVIQIGESIIPHSRRRNIAVAQEFRLIDRAASLGQRLGEVAGALF